MWKAVAPRMETGPRQTGLLTRNTYPHELLQCITVRCTTKTEMHKVVLIEETIQATYSKHITV